MRAVRGFLLDIDGTLLDSNDAHAEAWRRALEEQGFAVPFERIRPLIGMGSDKVVPLLTGRSADDPLAERLKERRGEIFRTELLPRLRPFPKARDLLEELGRRDIRRVAATSASEDDVKALLDVAAAVRAGVPTVAVRPGGWGDDDLRGAVAIVDDVAEICARLDEILSPRS